MTTGSASALRRALALIACTAALLATALGVNAQTRHALVIGNGSYKDAPLLNAVNDARAVAEALKGSGFQVTLRENVDHRSMVNAMREFGDRLRGGGVGLFYFAGHGMQIKGRNFLIPVGAVIEREDEVAYAALDAQAVLDKMEVAGNGTNIMILDACRNNPFSRSFRGGATGLAPMDAPVGTLVAFATSPGSVASDGSGSNGLYTQHLLTAMARPGSKVEDVFKQVRANVRRDSQGKQVPWEATSLEGDFYFRAGSASALPPVSAESAQRALDQAMWNMVKDSKQTLELRAYLTRFPRGQYEQQASARLRQIEAGQPAGVAAIPADPGTVSPEIMAKLQNSVPPSAAPAGQTQPAAAESINDAEIERRTEAILDQLAKTSPSLVPGRRPAASANGALPAGRNPAGFTLGDRWRYQVVDKYRGEVVNNYTLKVDRILPNGDMEWNGRGITTTPEGNMRRNENQDWRSREYASDDTLVPREIRTGFSQPVTVTTKGTRADGFAKVETFTGTLAVGRKERVRVPAGEFDAFRIERAGTVSGRQTNGTSQWYGTNTFVGWFVPELHNFVAYEFEGRLGSSPATRTRTELTSYEVSGFQSAQR